MTDLSAPSIPGCAGAIGIADTVNAGIAINAQTAKPINIERFIDVSLCAASIFRQPRTDCRAQYELVHLVRRDAW
jgi:hypothetical protein